MLTELEASRYKGCDKRTIRAAIDRGDLVLVAGKLRRSDLDGWAPKERRPRQSPPEPEPAPSDPSKPPPSPAPPSPAVRLKEIELERAEQAWARERGMLVEREQVTRLLADFAARVRAEIQSHPRRMQAQMVRHIRCRKCGGDVEGKIIAIEAERCAAQLLQLLANDPIGGAT